MREQCPLAHRRHPGRADGLSPELLNIHVDDRIGIEIDEPPHLGGQHLRRHEAVERRLRVARILHTLPENPLGLRKRLFREFPHIIELQLAAVLVHHAPEFLPILRRERPVMEHMEDHLRLRALQDGEHRRAEELRVRSLLVRKRIENMNFLLIIHLLSFYNLYDNIVSLQAFL